jgi:hypothetical protein
MSDCELKTEMSFPALLLTYSVMYDHQTNTQIRNMRRGRLARHRKILVANLRHNKMRVFSLLGDMSALEGRPAPCKMA